MTVFDASALLAYLKRETGSSLVRERLTAGGMVGAANWSEVAQKMLDGGDWLTGRALLLSYPLTVEPVTADDAETAARLWRQGTSLSLGDRLCLALGARTGATVLTADTAWSGIDSVELIR